jgi:hypothetical protein
MSTLVHLQKYEAEVAQGGIVKTKKAISNGTAWKLIVLAWHQVKQESIWHCFGHVPIFGPEQQRVLSGQGSDITVVETLKTIQNKIVVAVICNLLDPAKASEHN